MAPALVVALIAVVAADHYHLFDRGRSTPLSVAQIVHRYQTGSAPGTGDSMAPTTSPVTVTNSGPDTVANSAPNSSPATAPTTGPATTSLSTSATAPGTGHSPSSPLPAPGVYVYTTTGRDSVDALNGDHHDYPTTTTITVTSSACGVLQRWDVVKERWSSWLRCATATGVSEPARDDYDSFFGQGQHDAYTCAGASRPLTAAAGTAWTFTCTEGTTSETNHGVVVGNEQRHIGADTVDTLHVRVEIDDGNDHDTQVTDSWFLAGTDLLVAQTGQRSTINPSPVGAVHYLENYSIALTSTTPLR